MVALSLLLSSPLASPRLVGDEKAGDETAERDAHGSRSTRAFIDQHCLTCHDEDSRKGELDLESLLVDADETPPAFTSSVARHASTWERVIRKLDARQMPPRGRSRPPDEAYDATATFLAETLDRAAALRPDPGRADTLRRLTRTEYRHAIHDLLGLEIDVETLLPADESSHGFDNITLGTLSPTRLDRYISAAETLSRLAVGTERSPGGETIRIRPDLTQESHVEGLPLGTRGGALIAWNVPVDAEYEVEIRLARDRNEEVEGLREPHELDVLLDRVQLARFTVKPPRKGKGHGDVDAHLRLRFSAVAGPRRLGVTFLKKPASLLETKRQPYNAHFNMHRHPRLSPAIYQVSITGPFDVTGPGDTPSRRRLLVCEPPSEASEASEDDCAREILSVLMRRAYRRPVGDDDLARPMEFFRRARDTDGFDAGLERAIAAILVSPGFLFRVEREPPGLESGVAYELSDLELASRLSFFLWRSVPDDTLLLVAERGQLRELATLERETRRLLADPRSRRLVESFASQWLYLRNLESASPDLRLFPDFDDNLRQAFRRETELLVEAVVREDRSVLDLLSSSHTYLDERLARHYGVPHVHGSRFRRVSFEGEPAGGRRGGLLRHGSILTVTSYATRTSPVVRGHWILKNLLGAAPPPPPPDVPALDDNTVSASLPIRERLEAHRSNRVCAACHDVMDPVGFALERFDAVGRWRAFEDGRPIDATGQLLDGTDLDGVADLEATLLARPELFVGTLAERLLTFAIGRGVELRDAPAIRRIVRDAREDGYSFSSLIVSLTRSVPFRMRMSR